MIFQKPLCATVCSIWIPRIKQRKQQAYLLTMHFNGAFKSQKFCLCWYRIFMVVFHQVITGWIKTHISQNWLFKVGWLMTRQNSWHHKCQHTGEISLLLQDRFILAPSFAFCFCLE